MRVATQTTWLPPGTWIDANTGVVTVVDPSDTAHMLTNKYAINEVPLWYAAGAVIPYVPLRSLPTSVGNAEKQYTYLGFKIVPGLESNSGHVYEDDGKTTAYLTDNAYAVTTAEYAQTDSSVTVTITTTGSFPGMAITHSGVCVCVSASMCLCACETVRVHTSLYHRLCCV